MQFICFDANLFVIQMFQMFRYLSVDFWFMILWPTSLIIGFCMAEWLLSQEECPFIVSSILF